MDLTRIYRPRPGLAFSPVTLGGTRRLAWTTFTPQQIDIDVHSPSGRDYLTSILDALSAAGVSMVRLDAVGYAVKKAGTTCFMIPETFEFIAELTATARKRGIEVLVEVHSYYQRQIEIGRSVDRVYDFALPPLVLHAMYTGDGSALARWMRVRPDNAVTVLDTHDGIGVIDVGPDQTAADPTDRPGLLSPTEIDALVEGIHEHTGGASRQATGRAASNLDIYQVKLDLLRRAGSRRPALPGGAGAPVLHSGRPTGLLRRGTGRRQRSRPARPNRRRAGHQPAPLPGGRGCRRTRPTGGAGAADAVPVPERLRRLRRDVRVQHRRFQSAALRVAGRSGAAARHAELLVDVGTGAATVEWRYGDTVRRTDDLLEKPPAV